jgi:hypothetical protein
MKAVLGLLVILGLSSIAFADTVLLTNGHSVSCKSCKFKNGRAVIVHDCGVVTIPSVMVASVRS